MPDVVVVVGASGAGKSQLMLRYTADRFNESSKTTVGVDFGHKTLNFDGKVVKAQVRCNSLIFYNPFFRLYANTALFPFFDQRHRFGTLLAKYALALALLSPRNAQNSY